MDDILASISGKWKDRALILLVGMVLGAGTGTGFGYFRVGKFTSQDAADLEGRMIKRVNEIAREYRSNLHDVKLRLSDIEHTDRDLDKMMTKALQIVEAHEREAREWMGRIEVAESDILTCKSNIDKFWDWYQRGFK